MNILDLIFLAQCSKRINRYISLIGCSNWQLTIEGDKNPPQIKINGNVEIRMLLNAQKNPAQRYKHSESLGCDYRIRIMNGRDVLQSYWNNQGDGMAAFSRLLIRIFNLKIFQIDCGTTLTPLNFSNIIEEYTKNQPEIARVMLSGNVFQGPLFLRFAESVKVINHLSIENNILVADRFKIAHIPQYMKISFSHYFDVEGLIGQEAEDAEYVVLHKSGFHNFHLDQFVEGWKKGACPKLKYLEVFGDYMQVEGGSIDGRTAYRDDANRRTREKTIKHIVMLPIGSEYDASTFVSHADISQGCLVEAEDGRKAEFTLIPTPVADVATKGTNWFKFFVIADTDVSYNTTGNM